jgi:hypothetical protein
MRPRFVVDDALWRRLAYWRGNVAALHRELAAAAAAGGPTAPSFATLHRAVARDLSAGERAGLRKGEHVARAHDVFLQRPAGHRNAAWEADHVEAPVEVDVEGRLVKPHLKGTVEGLNAAAEAMFFSELPRYTHAPTLANRRPADPHAPALTYEAFVMALLDWVRWWNGHEMDGLDGRARLTRGCPIPPGGHRARR